MRSLLARFDAWMASQDDAELPTRARLDRHVLGGARLLGWILTGSLLGLHLPAVLFVYEPTSLTLAMVVILCALATVAATVHFGRGRRWSDGESLSSVVMLVGAISLLVTALVDTNAIEPHVLLAPIPVTLLATASIAPLRPARMLGLGLAVFAVQLLVAATGLTGGSHAFHVLTLIFTLNTVVAGAFICRVRRTALEQLYAREAELRSSNTRRGELLEDLQRAQSQLLASERMQVLGRLGAGLAHELKSPLAAVSNGLMELRSLARELHESVGHPDVEEPDLHAIVSDMMQTIRLVERAERRVAADLDGVVTRTRGAPRGSGRSFTPLREVRTVAELYEHRRRQLGAALEVDGDPAVVLPGERAAFAQIVSHLLDRALAAASESPQAKVSVDVRADGDAARLQVSDTGPALDGKALEQLFLPVADADRGVGLYVTRDVVEQTFGGRLEVRSDEGATVFTAWFPLAAVDRPPRARAVRVDPVAPRRSSR